MELAYDQHIKSEINYDEQTTIIKKKLLNSYVLRRYYSSQGAKNDQELRRETIEILEVNLKSS